jgi:sugar lactone lactonase YvrE
VKKLYWTDLFVGCVHRYDPKTGDDECFDTRSGPIGGAVPCDDENKLLVAVGTELHIFDLITGTLSLVAAPEPGQSGNRCNDTRADARGRIFTSTVSMTYGTDAYRPDMLGAFYMVDVDGAVRTLVDGVNQYNAIVWNSDDTKMFVVDTHNEKLLAFDYDIEKGPVSGPRVVIDFHEDFGMPDGLSIDSDDNLYTCHWTGKISIWDKAFNLKETVFFPVSYACCGGFAGEYLTDFYVATSKYGYTPREIARNPGAGGIFLAKTHIKGSLDHFYKIR